MELVSVTPKNVIDQTLFCIKDITSPGFKNKRSWFERRYQEGLRLKILRDDQGKPISFIEYLPADKAWRPVDAPNYMFIHCMYTYSNQDKGRGYGQRLVKQVEEEAQESNMHGVAVMTSKGPWITNKGLFKKCGYQEIDQQGRFELLAKKFESRRPDPRLIDWEVQHPLYQGWHLVYADQCPWHDKAVKILVQTAAEHGIDLVVRKIESAREAKNAPSGFGVFSLLHDGKLLEDHYISQTRFKTILNNESVGDL